MSFARCFSAAKSYMFYALQTMFLLLSGRAKAHVICTESFARHFCLQANKVRKKQRYIIKMKTYICTENRYSHTRKDF